MFFHRKSKEPEVQPFDRENLVPVLRCSICTGEQVAGFRDNRTGKFTEVRLIKSPQELEDFLKTYGLDSIKKEY